MDKFIIFTDPDNARVPKKFSIASVLQRKGLASPDPRNPAVFISGIDGTDAICIAYEPDPSGSYAPADLHLVREAIRGFLNDNDNCFVLLHAGSERDPSRHAAQAEIFTGYTAFLQQYRHNEYAPYTLFCAAIVEPSNIPALRVHLANPKLHADRIKMAAESGLLVPDEPDQNWKAFLIAVCQPDLFDRLRANPPSDHDQLYCQLNEAVNAVVNEVRIVAGR